MKVDLDEVMAIAHKTALKSPCRYKVSCLLIDRKGNIVATGYNHRALNGNRMGRHTIHAEVDAISKGITKPAPNLTAFIYRAHSGNRITPCSACSSLLKAYGINRIYYTWDGSWKED